MSTHFQFFLSIWPEIDRGRHLASMRGCVNLRVRECRTRSIVRCKCNVIHARNSFAFIPDRFMSISVVHYAGMPEHGFPSCSAVEKEISTIIPCALRKRSFTPSSRIVLQTATAEDEDMEPLPRCDYGQLACRLHSVWRSRCAISDREKNLSTIRTL